MNIKFYKKLCKFCDKILLSKKSSIFTHSVTALHVLKEHPVLMDYYFNFKNNQKKKIKTIKKKNKNDKKKILILYFGVFYRKKKF